MAATRTTTKVANITVIINTVDEEGNVLKTTVCERGGNYQWKINEPIYPRFLKMLHEISQACKAADVEGEGR